MGDCCIDNIYSSGHPRVLIPMNANLCDQIPLGSIISITGRSRSVFLNDRLRPFGLTAGQFPVLMLLSYEQNITQDRLVRHYHLDKGTIARAVKKLEGSGYIRRITDPTNRRAVRLFLSPSGEGIMPALKVINHEWEERVCAGLDRKGRQALATLMQTLAENSFALMAESAEVTDGSD